ncbi:MAG TPA: DUF1579 family protein [Terriglobales bacterium]|nr:DUF1579 family protein [Terriglobales bacterium]
MPISPRNLTLSLPIVLVLFSASLSAQASHNTAQAKPCTDDQQKQFDFWIGEWDLTWPGANAGEVDHGTNTIQRVMDGCVVQESFSGGDSMHLRGMSVSTYVPQSNAWKQTWVDNEGGYLDLVGGYKDGQMILSRESKTPAGTAIHMRMVFKNISKNEFDWSWEKSIDDGKSWQVVWPIHYKRKS